MAKDKGKLVRLTKAEASVVRVMRNCAARLPDGKPKAFAFVTVGTLDMVDSGEGPCPDIMVQSGMMWEGKPPDFVQAMALRAVSDNAGTSAQEIAGSLPDEVRKYVEDFVSVRLPQPEVH